MKCFFIVLVSILLSWNPLFAQLPNDACAGAISLTVGQLCDGMTTNADNRFAQNEGIVPAASCSFGDLDDIWFSFVAPNSGQVVFSVDQAGRGTIGELTVYSGNCTNLEEFACPFINEVGQLGAEFVAAGFNPGEVYYLRASTFDGTRGGLFCLQLKEKIGVENLDYGVFTSHNGSSRPPGRDDNNQFKDYLQDVTPVPLELDEVGICEGKTTHSMFARVEPEGVIKLKATSDFCESGFQGLCSAGGRWRVNNYQLRGLARADSIPVTFTFEFSGTMDVQPDWIGCEGFGAAGANFDFNLEFYESNANGDTAFVDRASGNIYYGWSGGLGLSIYEINNVAVNSGYIRTVPSILSNNTTLDINPFIANFVNDYNSLPASDKNNPNLALTPTFLAAIKDTFDLTVWDTTAQNTIEKERVNFFNALAHLNYPAQIGYNPNVATAQDLRFTSKLSFAYQKEARVFIDNSDLNYGSRLNISMSAFVGADNHCNPYTSTIDFTNTAKLIKIRVPQEFRSTNDATFYVSPDIELPIDGDSDCIETPIELPNKQLDAGNYSTKDTLTSASIIPANKEVTFISEKGIILKEGFHAQSGSIFSSSIVEMVCIDNLQNSVNVIANTRHSRKSLEEQALSPNVMLQAYPNPFNETTTIDYYLPKEGRVNLKLLNLMGQTVATIKDNILQDKGQHQVRLRLPEVSTGTYYLYLQFEDRVVMEKVVLIE